MRNLSRASELKLNTAVSLIYQISGIACSFILPKMLIAGYGSEVYGLTSSAAQYLGFISLAECGMGAVAQSALYKPLADGDSAEVSRIFMSADRFFKKTGCLLIVYACLLAAVFPLIVSGSFGRAFTAGLIAAIAVSTFAQYYFCMPYKVLLTADRRGYVCLGLQTVCALASVVCSAVMIRMKLPVQLVKLMTSAVFLLQPPALALYVKKNYSIDRNADISDEPIKQKRNGFAQHISSVVTGSTDVAVLTFFSLSDVSVYSVYIMVVGGIEKMIEAASAGMQALLGNIYAKDEKELLGEVFSLWEWAVHSAATFVYSCCAVLLVPFVSVYTRGINDADYIAPVFSLLITAAYTVYVIRFPYSMMIKAAGHYRETQRSCIAEAAINIVLSVVLVIKFGLAGTAAATLAAMIYRTVYCVMYLKDNIIFRSPRHFIKNIIADAVSFSLCLFVSRFMDYGCAGWADWIFCAVKTAAAAAVIMIIVNAVFYRENMKMLIKKLGGFAAKKEN